MNRAATGQAYYQQAELHRLRGDFAAAEAAYRDARLRARAAARPRPPPPGSGRGGGRRGCPSPCAFEATEPLQRAVLLPAYVEVALAQDAVDDAASGSAELDETAASDDRCCAIAAQVRGSVEARPWRAPSGAPAAARRLAGGRSSTRRTRARESVSSWGSPAGRLETRTAPHSSSRPLRAAFEALGATPELARVDAFSPCENLLRRTVSPRELEVLRLLASGRTNRDIAAEPAVSENTVARHVQNIFAKLGVSSRTAAAKFAFEHHLVVRSTTRSRRSW